MVGLVVEIVGELVRRFRRELVGKFKSGFVFGELAAGRRKTGSRPDRIKHEIEFGDGMMGFPQK
jgi:hypothetical protein